MTYKNGNYSLLKGLVDRVHQLNQYTDEMLMKSRDLMKSEDGGKVTGITPDAIKTVLGNSEAEDEICKNLQVLFENLKEDFQNKSINPSRYKEYMAEFKRLLTEGNKLITNRNLDVKSIVKELKKTPLN